MSNWKEELKQDQDGMPKEQVIETLKKEAEYVQDLDNFKPIAHNWIDRGVIMSCEGAGHPFHQTSRKR